MVPISYYDNVKDSVKDKDSKDARANFETLRKAAEESSENEEEKEGDDTSIEVLAEGLDTSGPTQKQKQKEQRQQDSSPEQSSAAQNSSSSSGMPSASDMTGSSQTGKDSPSSSGDMSAVEQKLDRIIEQNERMIEILESFGS